MEADSGDWVVSMQNQHIDEYRGVYPEVAELSTLSVCLCKAQWKWKKTTGVRKVVEHELSLQWYGKSCFGVGIWCLDGFGVRIWGVDGFGVGRWCVDGFGVGIWCVDGFGVGIWCVDSFGEEIVDRCRYFLISWISSGFTSKFESSKYQVHFPG